MQDDTTTTSRRGGSRTASDRCDRFRRVFRVFSILLPLALLSGAAQSSATLLGGTASLDVTTIDPPDIGIFAGNALLADAPVDFTFDDLALDIFGNPKWVFDVDFTGPGGLTVVITATRNAVINDFNGYFRSFELTGLHWLGAPFAISGATIQSISGTQASKWQAGATITEVGANFFTFETGGWDGGGVVFGDTIIATIQLEVQYVEGTGDTYEYDGLDRLVRNNRPDGSATYYTYDRAGNLLSRVSVPEPGLPAATLVGSVGLAFGFGARRRRVRRSTRTSDGARWALVAGLIALSILLAPNAFAQRPAPATGAGDWQERIRARVGADEYEVSWSRVRLRRAEQSWQAPNRAQGFRAHFLDEGVRIAPRDETVGDWEIGLSALAIGRGARAIRVDGGTPRPDGARVRYARGPVDEWFVNDRRGLEQGFTLHAPPRPGRPADEATLGARAAAARGRGGAVWISLRVEGDAKAVLAADRQSVDFVRAGVPVALAHYDKLAVVDAEGRILDSWMELFEDAEGQGIRLVFDDRDAEYPLEVDPLLTTPAWTATGSQNTAGLGFAVSRAGDVNGDGFDDVLVGAPFYDNGFDESGRAYLYLGGPGGLSPTPAWFALGESPLGTRAPIGANARFGFQVAGGGDVDGDGFDDILVSAAPASGAPGPTSPLPGYVFLYRGGLTGPADVADWTVQGIDGRRLGLSTTIAGTKDEDPADGVLDDDLNGDGLADVVIGEPGPWQVSNQGRVYVFYGQADGMLGGGNRCTADAPGTPGVTCVGGTLGPVPTPTVWGDALDEGFGQRVLAAGDMNCDGIGDLVVGQPRYLGNDEGRIRIHRGTALGVASAVALVEVAASDWWGGTLPSSIEFGKSLAAGGRVEPFACGASILVGAPGFRGDISNAERAGQVIRIRMGLTGQPPYSGSTFMSGTEVNESAGVSIANVGDLDGDGAEEFLVGAPGEPGDPTSPGRAYLVRYRLDAFNNFFTDFIWRTEGEGEGDHLGASVASAGDVNGDGLDDLLIGSPTARSALLANSVVAPGGPGRAFAFYGTFPVSLAELLGISQEIYFSGPGNPEIYAWSGKDLFRDDASTDSQLAAGVGSGPNPNSLVISTGLAEDLGRGDQFFGAGTGSTAEGEDDSEVAMILTVPAGMETLRFTTQYVTADPSPDPLATVAINYEFDELDASDVYGPPSFTAPPPGEPGGPLTLEKPLEQIGRGSTHNPVSHAIDVRGTSSVGLEIRITDGVFSVGDAAVVLSKVFFSEIPLPDYLSPDPSDPGYLAECAALGTAGGAGTDLDQNDDCKVDNVLNPLPSDLSQTAGSFRYSQSLIDVPGRLIDFDFAINYSSDRTREDQLGPKWSHVFDATLDESEDFDGNLCPDTIYVWTGGGAVEVFDEQEPQVGPPGCLYEASSPGNYSTLEADPAPGVDYTHETKEGFFSDYNEVSPGSMRHRRDFIAHPIGHSIDISYDAATGQIDFVEDSRGEQYDFSYDTSSTPARLTGVAGVGAQVLFDYNALGFLTGVTDASGEQTTFTYADDGKILTVTDGDGTRILTNEYEAAAGLGVDQSGDRIVRQFNGNGSDPGLTTAYTGDSVEELGRVDEASRERYDVFGRVVDSVVLLESSPPRSLDACDLDVPANNIDPMTQRPWCAVTKFAHNEANQVVERTDPRGIVTRFEYDALGNRTCRIEDADGTPRRTGSLYDDRNMVVARLVQKDASDPPLCPPPGPVDQNDPLATLDPSDVSQERWLITLLQYNEQGAGPTDLPDRYDILTAHIDPRGRQTTLIPFPRSGPATQEPDRGLLQTLTNAVGATRSYTYDALGHVRTETDPLGAVTTYTHDLLGRRTSVTDPIGHVWRWNYDGGGLLLSWLDPLFNVESFTYDAIGRPLTRTDRSNAVWTTTYTPAGRIATETDPEGGVVTRTYDDADRESSRVDGRGATTTFGYDAAGRLTTWTDSEAGTTFFEYDAAHNRSDVINARGFRTKFHYDALGRLIAQQDAVDLLAMPQTQTTFTYDTRNNLLEATRPHPLGPATTTQTWTDSGVLASIADPTGVTTTITYDDADQIDLRTKIESGRTTDYDWDLANRLTNVTVSHTTEGELATASAAYDAVGNTTRVTDPNGNPVEFEYDVRNELALERDGEGNEVTYGYEARGLLERRTNARNATSTSELTWTYDGAGRRIQTAAAEPGETWSIDDELDENGNAEESVVTASDPTRAPASVFRTFDTLDRQLTRRIEFAPGLERTVTAEYDAVGNLSALLYSDAGATRVDYVYDEVNRLTTATYTSGGLPQVTTYEYDAAGNLSRIVRPDDSETLATYDLANRPLTISDTRGPTTTFDASFQLDAAGRRIGETIVRPMEPVAEPDETFVFDAANRLVSRGGAGTLSYDADGNLVSGQIGGQVRSLTYDAQNQLVGVDTDVIRYDADGNRVARTRGGVTTYYLYDPLGRLLEEIDATGTTIARYVHGIGLISREAGSTISVYHYDSRGSTVALTDLDGTITDSYAYSPYGAVQRDSGNTTPNPFTYSGRDGVLDDGNGLYGMQARFYAPELMRFVQKDPAWTGRLDRPQSINRYAFVEGNPVEWIDPTGESGFSTVERSPRRRLEVPRATRASARSTGAPPPPPCTNPNGGACDDPQITAQSAGGAGKGAKIGRDIAEEIGLELIGDYLGREGYTAEKIAPICEELGGGICGGIRDFERAVGDVIIEATQPFADAYEAVTDQAFEGISYVAGPLCNEISPAACNAIGNAVAALRDFVFLDGRIDRIKDGLTGYLAEELDLYGGVAEKINLGVYKGLEYVFSGDVIDDFENSVLDPISDAFGSVGDALGLW